MILRPPWTRQPQYPAPVDMGQAATRLFDTLVNFNGPSGLKNLIQRDKAVSHSVAGFAARHSGMGLRSTGSGYVNLGQVGNYTSGSFFLVCRLMPESLAGGPVGIFKGPYGGAGYYAHFQGDIQFYTGGVFTGTGAGKLVVGKASTVVLTVDVGVAAGCRIWVDGVDVTSGGGGTHSPTSSSNDLSLLAYNTSSNFLPAVLHMFGCGNQKMPQEMARWLSTGENVWQLFKPPKRYIWVPVVASGVTGTLNVTTLSDTLAATGTTTILASLTATLVSDTLVGSGTTTVLGSLAKTLTDDTLVAAGSVGGVDGDFNATTSNDTLVAAGTTTVVGAINKTLNNDTLAGDGTTTIVGALAVTATDDTLSGTGFVGAAPTTTTYRPLTGTGT